MRLEVTVPEVRDLIKEIQQRPEDLFEMIRGNVKESVGEYLSVKGSNLRLTFLQITGGSTEDLTLPCKLLRQNLCFSVTGLASGSYNKKKISYIWKIPCSDSTEFAKVLLQGTSISSSISSPSSLSLQ